MAARAEVACISVSVKLLEANQCVYGEFLRKAMNH